MTSPGVPPVASVVNLSTVFGGLPLLQRADAARRAGWKKVECWWEFDSASPAESELEAFAASIEAADLQLVAINSHGGDRGLGERGLASLPDRQAEFRESIVGITWMAKRLGVRLFNVAAGNVDGRFTRLEQRAAAVENYRWAGEAVGEFGGTLLIEALSATANPGYPFRTGYDVGEFLGEDALASTPVGFLFDTYHLASNEVDLLKAWGELHAIVRHVQLADYPGRGSPGTGSVDFGAFLDEVGSTGYSGEISLEYLPSGP